MICIYIYFQFSTKRMLLVLTWIALSSWCSISNKYLGDNIFVDNYLGRYSLIYPQSWCLVNQLDNWYRIYSVAGLRLSAYAIRPLL